VPIITLGGSGKKMLNIHPMKIMLFTNGGTCLFDVVHSALWGSEYPVCTTDAKVLFLSGARMLHTQHSAVQALPSGV
jgi:hypothetical protein